MVGIIGAMEQEVAKIKEKMQDVTITSRARMDFYEGTLEGKKVVVVRSGIGKVNAGMCTQILADVFGVNAICEVYQNDDKLIEMSEKSQRYVREKFSTEAVWDIVKEDFE